MDAGNQDPWQADARELKQFSDQLYPLIVAETLKAVKSSPRHLTGRLLEAALKPSISKFADLAVEFNLAVEHLGAAGGCRHILPRFFDQLSVNGDWQVPASGPLILAANHPGGMDFLVLAAHARRDDIKIIAGEVDFLLALPAVRQYIINMPNNMRGRFQALQEAISHLRQGGVLGLFPTGSIDPDPHYFANAADHIDRWSQSLMIFLRKVPALQIQPVIFSQAISEQFLLRNWLVRTQKLRVERQRLAEFLQVFRMVLSRKERFSLKASFGVPLKFTEQDAPEDAMRQIKEAARFLLRQHLAGCPPRYQLTWREKPRRFRA